LRHLRKKQRKRVRDLRVQHTVQQEARAKTAAASSPAGTTKSVADGQEATVTAGIGVGEPLSNQAALERFKSVIAELEKLEADGKIRILERHVESQTGHRYVDRVKFERIS
jgi:hypothetical protein